MNISELSQEEIEETIDGLKGYVLFFKDSVEQSLEGKMLEEAMKHFDIVESVMFKLKQELDKPKILS